MINYYFKNIMIILILISISIHYIINFRSFEKNPREEKKKLKMN